MGQYVLNVYPRAHFICLAMTALAAAKIQTVSTTTSVLGVSPTDELNPKKIIQTLPESTKKRWLEMKTLVIDNCTYPSRFRHKIIN